MATSAGLHKSCEAVIGCCVHRSTRIEEKLCYGKVSTATGRHQRCPSIGSSPVDRRTLLQK